MASARGWAVSCQATIAAKPSTLHTTSSRPTGAAGAHGEHDDDAAVDAQLPGTAADHDGSESICAANTIALRATSPPT